MAPEKYGEFFVLSVDTLHGTRINQILPQGWADKPPVFKSVRNDRKDQRKLKQMCREGIPPALRCALWISNIVRLSHPDKPKKFSDEYGTLSRVRLIDYGYEVVLKGVFPHSSDGDEIDTPTPSFGCTADQISKVMEGVRPKGIQSMKRVLCSVQHVLGVEYCPMLPDLTAVLLKSMPESYAYASIREMLYNSSRYLSVTKVEHYSWCKTFADVVKKLYKDTAKEMESIGALSPEGLDPLSRRFFVDLIKPEHVARLMDIYSSEGRKIVLRVGIALIAFSKEQTKGATDAESFWAAIQKMTHQPSFNFELVIKASYKFSRLRFPKRKVIDRMLKVNEKWARDNAPYNQAENNIPVRPLGYEQGETALVLAKPASIRSSLASWLPVPFRATKLELIYSTNSHGRSLECLYDKCHKTKHTIMLVEVMETGGVIGMFATQAWHKNPKFYGDGACFLFSLTPDAKCFKWDPSDDDDGSADQHFENMALLEQFMIGRDRFIAMGGNKDGSSGLRINEDLTKGASAPALGFANEPLAGANLPEFEIGLVEVYRLLREIDGKPVDHEDDIWMFDQ